MKPYFLIIFLLMTLITSAQSWHDNKIIAHRGAWKKASLPQNSLASMAAAIDGRYHATEFDVRMTQDDILVIVHDPQHANLDIEKNTYETLAAQRLFNNEVLPTLEHYLKAGKKQKSTRLILEIKASPAGTQRSRLMADKTVALIKKLKVKKWITYISFDKDILSQILLNDPDADTQYLTGDLSPSELFSSGIKGMDYHYLAYYKNPTWIDECQKLGVKTNVWTVNEEDQIRYFLQRGIDFITTDEPEKATMIANQMGGQHRTLVWSDEFMSEGLPDSTIWTYNVGGHGWGNQELQFYHRGNKNNVFVSNGSLKITARKERFDENEYTSTRLVTYGSHNFTHGRIDVRAKLPKGRGVWPAIWTLGQNIDEVGWPACGEMDIMEHVGYDNDTIHASTHSVEHNHIKKTQNTKQIKIENPYESYHVYSVEYNDQSIIFLLDYQPYFTIKRSECKDWPFDLPHYLVLNVAVGGNWGGAQGVDEDIWPQTMEVDYVRVWK
jgi:beta-glucanase (GH16 family)